MGAPMARNLLKGGFVLRVFDLDPKAAAALAASGATALDSPAAAARGADCAITMLPNGEHVEAALFGRAGLADASPRGAFTST
jgi:3-hydroxyisobutyrate dehydrogenase-like beta-hydroxyacid dehydrogenase